MAAVIKGTEVEDLPAITRYLKRQMTKLGVKIRLGKEVNLSVIEKAKPDVVILAVGGIPVLPQITGIDRPNVVSSAELHGRLKFYLRFMGPKTLRWLTKFFLPVGRRVVIIGGAIYGLELGEFLVKRGRKVTIVETAETLGEGLIDFQVSQLSMWFQKKGATLMSGVKYVEVTDKGLTIITKEGNKQTIEADSIVPAIPLAPDTSLLKSFEGKVPEIYAVGDCREPKLIVDAIGDGSRIARAI
jgi:pyruvate/2-oxoglutarate dehydrogenase complex dihydrolipoamide dehydrogenase (E3) component